MKTVEAGLKTHKPVATVGPAQDDQLKSEADKYERTWTIPWYRRVSPAYRSRQKIFEWVERHNIKSIVDFGCGKGQIDLELARSGIKVHMIDIASNCLDRDVRAAVDKGELPITFEQRCLWSPNIENNKADGVLCIDLLEHLPPNRVAKVIRKIKLVAPHGFVNAALFPHVVNEHDLHLTVESASWWAAFFPDAEIRETQEFETDNPASSHVYMEW